MEGDRGLSGAEQNAAELLDRSWGNKNKALAHVKYALRPGRLADHEYLDQTEAAIKQLDPSKIKVIQNPGKMYEVNINADPEHFLDWDKPLSEQHPSVTDKLSTIVKDRNRTAAEWIGSSPGAEERLREAGIPGIKYLDQGSRGAAGGQTHNYVVFHHDLVDIVKKYGLAGLVAGGAAHFSTTPHTGDPFSQ